MIRLHLTAQGSFHVEQISTSSGWVTMGCQDFTFGTDLFVLGDVSKVELGILKSFGGGGLVLYSSPNKDLANAQILKQDAVRLGYPPLTKDEACRYSNERIDELYERYGGLPRLVWGTDITVDAHESRIKDSLEDIDGF